MLFHLALYVGLASIIDGFGYWGNGLLPDILAALGAQILFALAFNSAGMFFCFITRKTAAVNGLYLAFVLVPLLIISLLIIAFPGAVEYLFYDLSSQFGLFAQMATLSTGEIARGLAIGAGYLIIPLAAGMALFKKAEIK
jgi:hypothetical protein